MGWVKLDDRFTRHPKVIGLSLEAKWAYIEALCYAAEYRTDGIVPDVVAANGPIREELLSSGLWEIGTAAIRIHDFLDYNPSRAYYEDKAIAGAIGGAVAGAKRRGEAPPIAVPYPTPPEPQDPQAFDHFWAAYPRRVGKPKARSAFRSATRRATVEDIILGAKRYAEDPNRDDEYTAHPTTWLNRDGWNDPPLPARGGKQWAEHPLDRMARDVLGEVRDADHAGSGGAGATVAGELPGGSA